MNSDTMAQAKQKGASDTKRLYRVGSIFDGIINILAVIAGALLTIMALIVTYNVVMRYFVGKPPVWAIEMTEYILVYATFLAAPWVLRVDGHVKIDILVIRLSPRNQYILSIIVTFLGIVACGLLAWYGIKATYSLYSRNVIMMAMVPLSKWILIGSIPLGILLTLIQFLRMFLDLLRGKTGP